MSLLVAFALLLGPVIDYEPDGARMEVLLEDLSKKLERKLVPSAEVRDDVLVISARAVNPYDLLDKMAEALEATWDKKGETWTLIRTAEQRKARTERTDRQTLEWIRRAWEISMPESNYPPFNEKEASTLIRAAGVARENPEYELPWQRGPYSRAMGSLVRTLTPEAIAKLPLGQRVVFSSKPNRIQRAFAKDVGPILKQLEREFAIVQAALPGPATPEMQRSMLVPPKGRRPVQALLAVVREPRSANLWPVILDQNGLDLADGSGRDVVGLNGVRLLSQLNMELPNAEIELAPESQAWMRITSSTYGAADYSGTLLGTMFRQCSKRDPLSLVFTESARATSMALDKPIVLALTDGSYADMWVGSRQARYSVRTFDAMLRGGNFDLVGKDGWRIGRQPAPDYIFYERFDRRAVEAFAKSYDRDGAATLESAAALMVPQPPGRPLMLGRVLIHVGPGIGASLNSYTLLKVYGLAPVSQREALRAGRSLKLAELSSEQQAVLAHEVFGARWQNELRFDTKAYEYTSRDEMRQMSFRGDITEILPNGIPPDAPINLTHADSRTTFMKRADGLVNAFDEFSLADAIARARQNGTENKLRFKMGNRTRWDLGVGLTPLISKHFLFDEYRVSGDWIEYGKLPSEFRDLVDDLIKQNGVPGKGGGKPPPP